MQSLVSNFTTFVDGFLVHMSKRYRTDLVKARADWTAYCQGSLELFDDPKTTAKTIATLQQPDDSSKSEGVSEIKTQLTGIDSDSTASADSDDSSEEELVISVEEPAKAPAKGAKAAPKAPAKGTKAGESKRAKALAKATAKATAKAAPKGAKKPVVEESDDSSSSEMVQSVSEEEPVVADEKESSSSSSSDDASSQENQESQVIEVSQESSESSSPPPIKEKKKAVKATAKGAKAGGTKPTTKGELELIDNPKLAAKDRPEIPKGVKFLKGTNNIVVKGTVVATCSKKGIVPLSAINTKPLAEKGVKYEVWDAAKIKKTWKL